MLSRRTFGRSFGRNSPAERATELYGRLVAQARAPWFYSDCGVPDSPEGRLETVMLHVVMALRRLKLEGEAGDQAARALAECFVTDMDDCMREMGVGDLTVAKKVKKAAAALFDRDRDYGQALDAGDAAMLAGLLDRHLLDTDGMTAPSARARRLAGYAMALHGWLAAAGQATVLSGAWELPGVPSLTEWRR